MLFPFTAHGRCTGKGEAAALVVARRRQAAARAANGCPRANGGERRRKGVPLKMPQREKTRCRAAIAVSSGLSLKSEDFAGVSSPRNLRAKKSRGALRAPLSPNLLDFPPSYSGDSRRLPRGNRLNSMIFANLSAVSVIPKSYPIANRYLHFLTFLSIPLVKTTALLDILLFLFRSASFSP